MFRVSFIFAIVVRVSTTALGWKPTEVGELLMEEPSKMVFSNGGSSSAGDSDQVGSGTTMQIQSRFSACCPSGQYEGFDRDRLPLKHRQSRVALPLVTFATCWSSKIVGVMGSQPMQSSVQTVGVFAKPDPGSRVSAGYGRITGGAREVGGRAAKRLLEGRWQPMVVYIS
ncbi:hypothetical protein NE237_027414 [Protea cynaroides]|uniref:Secreted protein n=1 Tax=Protea cynaroides TaxID=273540 RepID=A0A9Q0JT56_9MAGN|nr:hypothetical protein NE237_027414 [Protea cynaroides]